MGGHPVRETKQHELISRVERAAMTPKLRGPCKGT
jgi:hypothetical protein